MDYNDNDYQSHLSGEDSSKVSPVLHPYALPKFDFDDSLQGHLRFDSLVENEVFLGIPSQEDNQWIEDFSRASSGIEFSSSAADSCSIPRRNNVWSEATSTESVEMLLKSVGQEEMVPGGTIIEELDAGNELGCLTQPVESSLKLDGKRDVNESSSASPADEPDQLTGRYERENISMEHAQEAQEVVDTQEVEMKDVEMQEVESIADDVGGEGSSGVDAEEIKSIHENPGEDKTSLNESLPDKSVPFIQSAIDADSLPVSVEKMDSPVCPSENTSGSPSEHHKPEEKPNFVGKESSTADEKLHASSAEREAFTKLHASSAEREAFISNASSLTPAASELEVVKELLPETRMIKVEEPSGQMNRGNLTADECKYTSCVEVSRSVEAYSKGLEDKLQLEGNNIVCQDKAASISQHCLETRDTRDQEHGSKAQMENAAAISDGLNTFTEKEDNILVSCTPRNLSVSGACTISEISEPSEENFPEGPSIIQEAPVSAEPVLERSVPKSLETENISDRVFEGDACAGDNASLSAYVDTTNEDISGIMKEEVLPVEIEKGRSSEDDHGVRSSSEVFEHEQIPKEDQGSKFESSALNKRALDSGFECKSLISGLDLVSVPPFSGSGTISIDRVDHGEKLKPASDLRDTVNSTEKKETEKVLGAEAAVSTLKEPSVVAGQLGPLSIDAKDSSGDGHMEIDPMLVDHNVTIPSNPDTASQVKEAESAKANSECSRHAGVFAVNSGSTIEIDACGVEPAALEKNLVSKVETVKLGKTGVEGSSGVIGGHKHDFGDVISSALSSSKKNMTESRSRTVVENAAHPADKIEIAGKAQSTSAENVSTEVARGFTFDATPLAGSSKEKAYKSIPSTQACQLTEAGEGGVHLTSGNKQPDTKVTQGISQSSPLVPDKGSPSGGAKGERKPRRSSGKAGKENAKKGSQVKEINSSKQLDRGDKSGVTFSPPVPVQKRQFEAGSVERNIAKSSGVPFPTSSLPDLNTSSPAPVLFHQPFTDLQQVQLRAQIFVYGSLIQGAAPEEACMDSAFGASASGGRSVWDPAWRACVERIRGQRSHPGNAETPLASRSGSRTPDQTSKHVVHQNKGTSSAAGRASSKSTTSPVVSPIIPLSSPLWNMSTPSCDGLPSNGMARGAVIDYKALSPMHPYQTPPVRNFVGHAAWLPQSPFPGAWVASPQMSSAQRPVLPVTEPVKLTPVKESISSGSKHIPPDSVAHAGDNSIVAGASPHDSKKASVSRKRKKASADEDRAQVSLLVTSSESVPAHAIGVQLSNKAPISDDFGLSSSVTVAPLLAQSQAGPISAPVVSGHFSTSVVITPPPSSVPKSSSDILLTASTDLSKRTLDFGKKALFSDDLSKVEESKLRAEEAAADAAAAVGHCQDVWSRLEKHKNSDMVSDIHVRLSSAAVAVAAATSVAKAAAAAAKIALNAALQAKLMADEALVAYTPSNSSQTNPASFPVGSTTPASIFKGWDVGSASGSVIFAAREAARRRIEAASAASKHAENLDAIVKAAELAAEAVSHAGKIVSLGDPLPLSQLVEAGPDSYWKDSEAPSVEEKKLNGNESSIPIVEKTPGVFPKRSEGSSDEGQPAGVPGNMTEDNVSTPITGVDKDAKGIKGHCVPEVSNTVGLNDEAENDSGLGSPVPETCGNVQCSKMPEGSLIEVLKDGDDGKRAWYSAKVVSLKNGKALVCYTDHQSDEGLKQLKDWIPLDEGSDESPRIRPPHPVTALQGEKKRRRAAVKEYTWYVGDRVDAWIDYRWREGVIGEKNKRDETTFSVNFPDYGDTAVVRAWHLRPSLVWKDGEWVEWSSSRHDFVSQGDTPKEKRMKLGNPASDNTINDGLSKKVTIEAEALLPLAVSEKTFNIGSSKDDKTLRTMRSGLQKEGSKVFGVPKPGKKRKFMEVSKHYVSDRATKSSAAAHDSAKLTKYLTPQATGGWSNSSRFESKEKQVTEAKRRPPKPNKLPTSTKNLKDNSYTSSGDDAIRHDKDEPRQPNLANLAESHVSSQAFRASVPKKASTSSNREERLKKKTPVSANLKSSKVEVKDKVTPEVNEPRRSNRKIQPTSRLLEGIQSSLVISKSPSVSHDKGNKGHSRGASKIN